jgi:hypothetical protein
MGRIVDVAELCFECSSLSHSSAVAGASLFAKWVVRGLGFMI